LLISKRPDRRSGLFFTKSSKYLCVLVFSRAKQSIWGPTSPQFEYVGFAVGSFELLHEGLHMNRLLLVSLAGVSMLALAACGESEQKTETPPATTEQPAAPAEPAPAPAAPAEPAPAPTAPAAPADPAKAAEDAMNALKEQAASMTAEQKQQAVTAARTSAEAAAKAAGQTDDQAKQAGDAAEAAAKQALGVQ
jgi:hypothetical protein